MKKNIKSFVFYLGILVFAVGILLYFIFPEADGAMEELPFVLTGFGAGIIGVGVAGMLMQKKNSKDPKKAKQYEINENDERNISIREKACSATWYITLFVLAAVALTLFVMDYTVPFVMVLAAFFLHIISMFVFIVVYNKNM